MNDLWNEPEEDQQNLRYFLYLQRKSEFRSKTQTKQQHITRLRDRLERLSREMKQVTLELERG